MPFPPMNSPSVWYGELTTNQKNIVMQNVKIEAARLFKEYRKVLKDALGLEELKGPELLNAYRARTPEIWANLQQHFPDTYEEQMTEWGKLEQKTAQSVQIPPSNPALTTPEATTAMQTPQPQGIS